MPARAARCEVLALTLSPRLRRVRCAALRALSDRPGIPPVLVFVFSPTHPLLPPPRRAARVVAKLLDSRSTLMHLDLSNNAIHTEGGKALARALRGRPQLLSLNLRLNQLGEAGGRMLLDALCNNTSLQRLNISANGLGMTSGVALAGLVHTNRTLLDLDVSANALGADAGSMVKEALAGNKALRSLDVRRCDMGDAVEEEIIEMARMNIETAVGMGKAGTVLDPRAFMVSKMAYGQ